MMVRTASLFEGMQKAIPFSWVTDSGFSSEDLVSNLLGFYRVVRPKDYFSLLQLVSKQNALTRWDHHGSVGKYKNKLFKPLLFPDPQTVPTKKPYYGELPAFMKEIQPFNNFTSDIVRVVRNNHRHGIVLLPLRGSQERASELNCLTNEEEKRLRSK